MFCIFLFSLKIWMVLGAILLVLGIIKAFSVDDRRRTYDDNFGSPQDILSKSHTGFVVDGVRKISRDLSFRNMMVTGGVGSGKSQTVALPFLQSVDNATILVNDPSGELLSGSYSDLIEKGYTVRVFRPRDPLNSLGYNVLERANTVGQINKVAQTIVSTTLGNQPKDPFWNQSSISLLSIFIRVLKLQPKEFQNLYNLRYLLELFIGKTTARQVDTLFIKADKATYSSYRSFLGFGDKTLQGVVASCLASLSLMQDSDVARTTAYDTIGDFSDLRRSKQAIFAQNNVTDISYLRFITDLMYSQLFEFLLSHPVDEQDLDLMFVLDEFGSSMRIPEAATVFATLRKTRSGLLIINQSVNQLKVYGNAEADVIASNCYTKLYLSGGLDLATATHLEKRGGRFEFVDGDNARRVIELLTAAEILNLEPEIGLLDVGGMPLMKVPLTPNHKQFRFQKTAPPVMDFKSEIPLNVPLLPI